jgi:hypothetical protein
MSQLLGFTLCEKQTLEICLLLGVQPTVGTVTATEFRQLNYCQFEKTCAA